MTRAHCQTIMVDGEPVLLRVTEDLNAEEQDAVGEVIRAAQAKLKAQRDADPEAFEEQTRRQQERIRAVRRRAGLE